MTGKIHAIIHYKPLVELHLSVRRGEHDRIEQYSQSCVRGSGSEIDCESCSRLCALSWRRWAMTRVARAVLMDWAQGFDEGSGADRRLIGAS